VLGVVLYLQFAGKARPQSNVGQVQASNSFLTALAETHVPACNVRFSEAARACAMRATRGLACTDPCAAVQSAMDAVVNSTLLKEGRKYNLSIAGTTVQNASNCRSADPATLVIAAPQVAIVFGDGRSTNLTLALCR
jgi:hypothetical protein